MLSTCSFNVRVTPDERVVSRYMEECRRVTVGLISGNWFHHPNQLPPVMEKKEEHQHQKPQQTIAVQYISSFCHDHN